MTTFVFANNIDTTLASSISSSATSITLSSGTNLPALAAGQTFVVTLNDAATQQIFEIMYATAISGTTLTVSRAQEGTTAQAWAAGDYVFSGPTAGQMRSFYQGQSVGQGTVTSVGMSMPSGFSVSGSPITVAGTLGVTFASQNAGLFLATPVTGGAAGAATWRSMAAADVNGALGYTPIETIAIASANGVSGTVAIDGATQTATLALGAITPNSISCSGEVSCASFDTPGAITCAQITQTGSSSSYNNITLNNSGGVQVQLDANANMEGNLRTVTAHPLTFYTNNTLALTLSAAQQATFAGGVTAAAVAASGSVTCGSVNVNGDSTNYTVVQIANSGGVQVQLDANANMEGNLRTTTAHPLTFCTNNTLALTLSADQQATFAGGVTCATMNASSSDRRLKRDIHAFEPRPIHRTVPFVSYTLKENGWHGLGSVAQRMQKIAPEHVGEFDWHGKKRLSLDYSRAAYEEAMWAGLALDKALDRIKVLEKRLAALERRV